MFASPRWLLLGAPALALPVLVMLLHDPDSGPTSIEQAIAALPLPGDAVIADGSPNQVFGPAAGKLPPSLALRLYANSARAVSERPERRDDGPDQRDILTDFEAEAYAALHPRSLAGEDLLVGDYALLTQSLAPDLSYALLAEFCSARPEDPGYLTKLSDLPLSSGMLTSLSTFIPGTALGTFCKRFG